jgi:hypothetical protein
MRTGYSPPAGYSSEDIQLGPGFLALVHFGFQNSPAKVRLGGRRQREGDGQGWTNIIAKSLYRNTVLSNRGIPQ